MTDENDTLDTEDTSALEKEFEDYLSKIRDQIDEKLTVAAKALQDACELSDAHGVPFYSHISFLSQSYIPRSFPPEQFKELDEDLLKDIAEAWGEPWGWEHSAVC